MKQRAAFTLIELLITAAVIMILTGFILTNYPSAGREFALKRSVNKLAQDIWQVQSKSISMEKFGGAIPKGYGIYFNIASPSSYKLFADKNSNWQWDGEPTDGLVEDISFESKVEISGLEAAGVPGVSFLNIVFQPPDPTVWINNINSSSSTIALRLNTGTGETGSVYVNSSGLITTQ